MSSCETCLYADSCDNYDDDVIVDDYDNECENYKPRRRRRKKDEDN